MKKIYSIISITLAAVLATACVFQLEAPEVDSVKPDGQTATFTFVPSILGEDGQESTTKLMSSLPQIHNIYFAVFDNAGYKLNEYAQAIPNTYADQNWNPEHPDENVFSYSVTLTVTDQPRIIHIIANAPEHLIYGSEAEVIGSLNTRFNASETEGDWSDAYWVRIYLDNGVWSKPDESTRETDPAFDTKYDKWMHVVETLNEAKLVRNFARITLEETADNFELTRYWLTNIPDIGSFAPYNRNTGRFQIDYNQYNNIEALRSPEGGNYPGFFPASASLFKIGDYLDDPGMMSQFQYDGSKSWTSYCYEREFPREDPIYLIVAGRYMGGAETFYKIDLRNHEGEYFPILRNFTYKVRITRVSTKGANSIAKALTTAPSGAVDTALEMQELTNISNGTSQMFVSETSELIVGEAHDIILRYKYIPNLHADDNHDGYADAVNDILETGSSEEAAAIAAHRSYVTLERTNGITGPVFSSVNVVGGHDADNYSDIILRSNDAGDIVRTETIAIIGHYWNPNTGVYETIRRSSNFRLSDALPMTVSFSPAKIPAGNNQPVDLVIGLQAGLPSSVFSLDFDIELLGLTLTTNNDPLPVTTGQSMISGNSKPAFHFQKTITWTDYVSAPVVDGYKQFVCHFKTNKSSLPTLSSVQATYTTAGGEDVLPAKPGDVAFVQNHYFVSKLAYYSTYSPLTFSNINISGANEVGENGTLSFTMQSPFPNGASSTTVTVGMKGFEPTDMSTYTLVGMRDGYELYEMTVYNSLHGGVPAYQGSMDIVPFDSGECSVMLMADEYTSAGKTHSVRGVIPIYVNEDGSGSGLRMVQQGYQVLPTTILPASGYLVAGQTGTITIYIADGGVDANVQIGGLPAARSTTAPVTNLGDGKTYYRYQTMSYTAPVAGTGNPAQNYGAHFAAVPVTVGGSPAKRLSVPVYGIQKGSVLTNVNFSTASWYVIQNASTSRYMYSRTSGTSILKSDLDYYCLLQFGNTASTSSIKLMKTNATQYYLGSSGNNNVSVSNTAYSWAITRVNSSNPFRIARGNNRYIYENNSAIAINQQNNPDALRSWNIYPVTLVAPE